MKRAITFPADKVLPVVSAVTFLGFLDTHLLIPVISLYTAELGAGVGTVGLVVGLYSLTNTPANIFFGRLIDKFGHRLPLVAGLVGDAAAMFLYSVCRLPWHLALVRVWHGLSGGMVGPATMSLIAGKGGVFKKGRAMAYYGMSLAAATLVGYGLSGFLASRLGYQAVFFTGGGLLVLGVFLGMLLPADRRQAGPAAPPLADVRRKAVALFRERGLLVAYCSVFAQYFTFGGVVTLLPLYIRGLGMEAFHVGILLAVFAVMFIIVQFPSGALADRVGRRLPVFSGLGLGIVALVLMPVAGALPLLMGVLALYGVAYGLLFPAISALVVDHAPAEERGLATGIFHALLTGGVALGAPLMGWLGGLVGIEAGLALTAAVMLLALLLALGSKRHIH